ncbi:MAG: type IV pilin protein [Rhodanobacter sp.]
MMRSRGFSLIELLIVVAIVAILAAFAAASYQRYSYRSRRVDAQQILMNIAIAEERYYSTGNQYTFSPTAIGYASPLYTPNNDYSVTIGPAAASTSAQAYVATATPIGTQAGDVCKALSIDNTGDKEPSASETTLNSNGNCW